eukprot:GFUD01012791.1.p1 GENE.GFUD01012791.1~~GFUD01012791.1.p1  ORF type:complete len:157 (-),score=28.20 GFUD01012791.1:153-623(-)
MVLRDQDCAEKERGGKENTASVDLAGSSQRNVNQTIALPKPSVLRHLQVDPGLGMVHTVPVHLVASAGFRSVQVPFALKGEVFAPNIAREIARELENVLAVVPVGEREILKLSRKQSEFIFCIVLMFCFLFSKSYNHDKVTGDMPWILIFVNIDSL